MKIKLFLLTLMACSVALAQTSKEKIRAIRDLGKQGSSAIESLRGYLKDTDSNVREEAVEALTTAGTQHSIDPLIEATRDNDPTVQERAVAGLVNFYLPGYVKRGFSRVSSSVRSQFDKENTEVVPPFVEVRADVASALGALARGGSSMESRAASARAAGVLRARPAIPDLIEALKSKDDTVMFESLIALQKIRDSSAGPNVLFLFRDLNERVRAAAIETAGLLQAREAIPSLQTLSKESASPRIKRAIITALAMLPDPASRSIYSAALSDKDEKIRTAALEGYARLKSAEDTAAVKQVFETERKAAPRLAAAFALVAQGDRSLGEFSPLPYIINSLNTRSVETAAEVYLRELAREASVRAVLHERLQSAALKPEKIGIARALGENGDQSSVAVLEKLSKEEADPEVAQEALGALRLLRLRLSAPKG